MAVAASAVALAVSPFVPRPAPALDEEHGVVSRWVEEAFERARDRHSYQDVELKSQPSGRIISRRRRTRHARYVHAAAVQTAHWDRLSIEIRSERADPEPNNPQLRQGWSDAWVRRRRAATVVSTLMRRALPFEEDDLIALLDWCNGAEQLRRIPCRSGHITRALQRFCDSMRRATR